MAQTIDSAQQDRAFALGQRLGCPQCDGQVINTSESDISKLMKNYIRKAIAEGKSDQEIINFFRDRYGNEVVLRTGREGWGLLRWGPWLLLMLVLVFMIVWGRHQRKHHQKDGGEGEAPW